MNFFDRMERRWGWMAFPGFLRYYALMHVLVFVVQILRPDVGELLAFDRAKILSGEVWRMATMFFAFSDFGRVGVMTLVFLYFAVMFMFMVSDGLEAAWGAFKCSLFYYTGIVLILLANFFYPFAVPGSGTALYGASFLAFATLFPRLQVRLMFLIPIQIKYLGMLAAGAIVLSVIRAPILLPFVLVAYSNYVIWAGIPALRGTARVLESVQRRKKFNAAKIPATEAFHTCAACKKTDISDPHLEFRIGSDGQEYCAEHLPE